MTSYLRFVLPVVICLTSMFGAIVNYIADNDPACYANLMALCGWLVIAMDEFLLFRNSNT